MARGETQCWVRLAHRVRRCKSLLCPRGAAAAHVLSGSVWGWSSLFRMLSHKVRVRTVAYVTERSRVMTPGKTNGHSILVLHVLDGFEHFSDKNGHRVISKRSMSVCLTPAVDVAVVSHAGEVFHGVNKEDHRHAVPAAPRNSPTGVAPLPALAPAALSPGPTPHLANLAAPTFPKTAVTSPSFVEPRKSFCPASVGPPPPATDGSISAPPSVCR